MTIASAMTTSRATAAMTRTSPVASERMLYRALQNSHMLKSFTSSMRSPTQRSPPARGTQETTWSGRRPAVGIFAQRGKNRPNRLGSTTCRLMRIEGTRIFVAELDAIDKTPVLDIKPVMSEFLPREPIRQPAWSRELMRQYWLTKLDISHSCDPLRRSDAR